jgi:hypothetical protein
MTDEEMAIKTSHFRRTFGVSPLPEDGGIRVTHLPSGQSVLITSDETQGSAEAVKRAEDAIRTLDFLISVTTYNPRVPLPMTTEGNRFCHDLNAYLISIHDERRGAL